MGRSSAIGTAVSAIAGACNPPQARTGERLCAREGLQRTLMGTSAVALMRRMANGGRLHRRFIASQAFAPRTLYTGTTTVTQEIKGCAHGHNYSAQLWTRRQQQRGARKHVRSVVRVCPSEDAPRRFHNWAAVPRQTRLQRARV